MSPSPSGRELRLVDVAYAHVASVPILESASAELHVGWTAVVGENGAGKTTLLRLLAGELVPDAGEIRLAPKSATTVWCRQVADTRTPEIRAFGERTDGAARRWQGRLRLDPDTLARWETLSPGERRRWQIGAALAADPGVLLLDEPTDHLDADARDVLVDALLRFDGIGVVVSHDRALLRALSTTTVRLRDGGLDVRRTGFDEASDAWLRENDAKRQTREKLRREEKRLRRSLARKRSSGSKRKRKRGKPAAKDSDSRSMQAKNSAGWAAARASRDVAVLRDRGARVSDTLDAVRFDKRRGSEAVSFAFEPSPVDPLATLRMASMRAGRSVVLEDVACEVRRETRVWVRGANGAGKSTLLTALLGACRLTEDRRLALPQEIGGREVSERVERVRALGTEAFGRFLGVAGALGADPERILRGERPSPGEARKLVLADGLANGVAALFLDEPTNHLDLPSIERLEGALAGYPGAIVLVTHDADLARACTTETWTVADGRVQTSEP